MRQFFIYLFLLVKNNSDREGKKEIGYEHNPNIRDGCSKVVTRCTNIISFIKIVSFTLKII